MKPDDAQHIRIIVVEAQGKDAVRQVLNELGIEEALREFGAGDKYFIGRIDHMRDINNVSGQAGSVGSNSSSKDSTFTQIPWPPPHDLSEVNPIMLAAQLELVRLAMRRQLSEQPSVAEDDEIGHVARAQIAAQSGDIEAAKKHLKRVGAWTLRVARETSAEIVALFLAHLAQG